MMDLLSVLWSIIGIVFVVWIVVIGLFSLIGALAYFFSERLREDRGAE